MESGDDYARRTERIKNLLSSYYGNEGGGQPQPAGDPPSADHTPAGSKGSFSIPAMDSPAFNAEKHIAQMLKSYTLEKMMFEHHNMAREIKNLDSDMQQLVYENYNKFIAATDTIRDMKANVDGIGGDMERLKTIIDNVADKSNAVNQKLSKRRDHIEELHKVQQLLRKLQAVFDLPRKMRAALEEDCASTAVSFYCEALPLLRRYGQQGAFRAVASESEAVAREIGALLKRRLAERKDDTEQSVLLLRKLGEPDESLQDKYLQGRTQRMRTVLRQAEAVVDAVGAAAAGSSAEAAAALSRCEAPGSWGCGEGEGGGGLPELRALIKTLDERMMNAMQETVLNVTSIFMGEDQGPARRAPLVAVAKELLGDYLRLVRRAVADSSQAVVRSAARLAEAAQEGHAAGMAPGGEEPASLGFLPDWGADMVAQALSTVSADLSMLHPALPELGLRERAQELVQGVVKQHVGACFAALQQRVIAAVQQCQLHLLEAAQPGSPLGGQGQVLASTFAYIAPLLQKGIKAVLQGVRVYESHPRLLATWHDAFIDLVQGALQQLFMALLAAFMDLTGVKYDGLDLLHAALRAAAAREAPGQPSAFADALAAEPVAPMAPEQARAQVLPALILLLAKVCVYMESSSVPFVMETIASMFSGRGGGRGSEQPPAFVAGEVARRLGTGSNALVSTFVELHGRQLSLMVRRSVAATNWLQHKEPRAPRPVCDLMLERLARAQAEMGQLLEGGSGKAAGAGAGPGGAAVPERPAKGSDPVSLEAASVERNVAKLFKERVKLSGSIKFSQPSIFAAIIGVGLKALVECIRLQTLGRAGLQQLQLDAHYLRPRLRRFVAGSTAAVVDSLVDEVIAAGVERSTDPTLLEVAVLDRILSSDYGST